MTYKPDQLQPVSNMIRTPNIVSVHPSVPVKSIGELIAYIKANPDKLSYATSGVGQSPHLTAAWFLQLTGLSMPHIPFRGAGPRSPPCSADRCRCCSTISIPRCRSIAKASCARSPSPRSSAASRRPRFRPWRRARRSLPSSRSRPGSACSCRRACRQPVLDALNAEIKVFLDRADTQARIKEIGSVPDHGTPAQYTAFVQGEIEKFGGSSRKEKLQMDIN